MQFSDTSNYTGIIQTIDFLLFGDGTTQNTDYSVEDRTRNVNRALDEVTAELFKADPNFRWDDTNNTDFPLATATLTSGLDHYSMPDSSLVVNRVRVKDSNGKWQTLEPKLRREFSDTELSSTNTGTPEAYYKMGGAIFPIPISNYTSSGGIELEFQRGGNYFTSDDTTDSPGFAPIFHIFLPVSAALDYARANGMTEKVNMLTAEKERIRMSMVEHYEKRSPDERPRISLKRPSTKRFGL